jgi:hypothetical protein
MDCGTFSLFSQLHALPFHVVVVFSGQELFGRISFRYSAG